MLVARPAIWIFDCDSERYWSSVGFLSRQNLCCQVHHVPFFHFDEKISLNLTPTQN